MNILLVPDSFKNSLTAQEVCESLTKGLLKADSTFNIVEMPLADGGEGTLEVLVKATGGKIVEVETRDPLQRTIHAPIGILGDGETAVVEMAKASGIELLEEYEKNPLLATTFGTGMLIEGALDHGCKKIILGIGGSATNDGGAGAASALGARLYDVQGIDITEGAAALHFLDHIDLEDFDARIKDTEFIVACDVVNPLCGENGATYVYGPQKGARPEMLDLLEKALQNYSSVLTKTFGKDYSDELGAGAAGGLGAGAMAFLGAEMKSGFSVVCEYAGLADAIAKADVVITGEGKIDSQTSSGKVVAGVAAIAKKNGPKVIAIGGTVADGAYSLYENGVEAIVPIVNKPMSLDEAIENGSKLVENTGELIGRLLNIK